jgi:hypothetical protein
MAVIDIEWFRRLPIDGAIEESCFRGLDEPKQVLVSRDFHFDGGRAGVQFFEIKTAAMQDSEFFREGCLWQMLLHNLMPLCSH